MAHGAAGLSQRRCPARRRASYAQRSQHLPAVVALPIKVRGRNLLASTSPESSPSEPSRAAGGSVSAPRLSLPHAQLREDEHATDAGARAVGILLSGELAPQHRGGRFSAGAGTIEAVGSSPSPMYSEVTRRRMCMPSMGEFHCAALHRCRPSTTQGWTYSETSSMTPTRSTSGKVRSFLVAGIARPRRRTHDRAADPPLDPPHPHNRSGLTPSARRKARAHATAAVATAATAPHPVAVEPDPCTARATAAAVRNVGCHPGSRRTRRACNGHPHPLAPVHQPGTF